LPYSAKQSRKTIFTRLEFKNRFNLPPKNPFSVFFPVVLKPPEERLGGLKKDYVGIHKQGYNSWQTTHFLLLRSHLPLSLLPMLCLSLVLAQVAAPAYA
jgi:hypothetical protein